MGFDLAEKFSEICGIKNVKISEPMSKHTTFKLGGCADVFLSPESETSLAEVIKLCTAEHVRYVILGNGSNVIVSDSGIRGVVISTVNLINTSVSGNTIYASAGILMSSLSSLAAKNSLSGLEFAGGIPGSFGGGLYMNAGAYGGELKDVVKSVRAMDKNGVISEYSSQQCCFGYRSSIFGKTGEIILGATLCLTPGDKDAISALIRDFNLRRKEKQPLEFPSAGSTFKRPEGYFAGKLIADSGLSGYRIGGAEVSSKHCGFIINADNATSDDVLRLIAYVKNVVFEKFGVELHEEVKYID